MAFVPHITGTSRQEFIQGGVLLIRERKNTRILSDVRGVTIMVSIFSVQTSTSPTAGWSISVSAVMDFSYIPEHHAHSFSTVSESKTATEAPPAAPTVLAANTANMSTQDGG